MCSKGFFKLTKTKVIYLIVIALILFISGSLAQHVIYCVVAPCPQFTSTIIAQKIYSIVTFNELFINTKFAVQFKNLMQPLMSAGSAYLILSFIISMIVHYLIISFIIQGYKYFKNKK